jgi:hypothetical protein
MRGWLTDNPFLSPSFNGDPSVYIGGTKSLKDNDVVGHYYIAVDVLIEFVIVSA